MSYEVNKRLSPHRQYAGCQLELKQYLTLFAFLHVASQAQAIGDASLVKQVMVTMVHTSLWVPC